MVHYGLSQLIGNVNWLNGVLRAPDKYKFQMTQRIIKEEYLMIILG